MNLNIHLTSQRLQFGFWQSDMLQLALELWGNREVTRYIATADGFSDGQILERLGLEIAYQQNYGVQYWPLFIKRDEFIGCCGLRPRDVIAKIYEIGTHILPQYWYYGYANEAMQRVIAYAKEQRFTKLFAGHNPHNLASQKMLTKLGFISIGTEFYPPTGLDHPSYELELIS